MNETPNGPETGLQQYKRDVMKLYQIFHPDRLAQLGLIDDDAKMIGYILSDCLQQTGDGNHTPDSWPRDFAYKDNDITLVRPIPDGSPEYTTKPIRVPSSPREFVRILKEFVDTGMLNDGSRAQERKAPEKKPPAPEEVLREKMSAATSIKQLQAIAKTLDNDLADFEPHGIPRSRVFSPRMYGTLRFEVLPARASEILTAQISTALNAEKLETIFETILTSGLFRDDREPRQLSQIGESLLRGIFSRAEVILLKAIENAKDSQKLNSINADVERFFGCSLDEIKIYEQLGTKRRLSSSDRAKMTYEQQQSYDRGEGPKIRGPLSDDKLAKIMEDGAPIFSDAAQLSTPDILTQLKSNPLTSLFSTRFATFGQDLVSSLSRKIADRRLELQKVR